MLGVALSTILLPSLAKHYADESPEEYAKLLDWGLRLTLMLALPAAVALAILAVPLIATLFHYGEFSVNDVMMTRNALIAYSVGLLGLILVKVLAPGFYARQNIRTPVKIALVSLFATQAMNFIFMGPFKHAGLALAIGLGACVNAGLLYRQLRQHGIYAPQPGWAVFFFKVMIAIAAMGICLWFGAGDGEAWLAAKATLRVVWLGAVVMAGAAAYFATLWLLGFRLGDFTRRAA
jgi:putative peptidoglycan lipid II flippase